MQSHLLRIRTLFVCAALAAAVVMIVAQAPRVAAQQAAPSGKPSERASWNGIFSAEQAKRGGTLYGRFCTSCHGKDLNGTNRAPAAGGPAFAARWSNRPLVELLDYMQTQMPLQSAGVFTRHQNADILAYMLQQSGAAPGAKDFWVDGPEGGFPAKRAADFGTYAVKSTKRAEAFYTEAQAQRGRFVFNRNCANCHGIDPAASTPADLVRPLPSTLAGHYIERVMNGLTLYPNVYALYSKLQSMPLWNINAISPQQRVDAIAFLLQMNGLPAGTQELTPDTGKMRLMMLNEPGFERLFNGRDFTGWDITSGFACGFFEGCTKHGPLDLVRVEDEMIVCECEVYGHMVTNKKYKDFTLRFESKFERPRDLEPEDNEELFSGGGGYKVFADLGSKSIEVEGRHRDLLELIRPGGTGVMGRVDLEARRRVMRPLGQWNSIEISTKGGAIQTLLNGTPITSVRADEYPSADYKDGGHILFQIEGTRMYWRNIRIRVD